MEITQTEKEVTLKRGPVSFTFTPERLWELAGQYKLRKIEQLDLIGQDTPLSNFHELMRDKIKARYYNLVIEFREQSSDPDGGDAPERVSMELSLAKYGQKIDVSAESESWSGVDFGDLLNEVARDVTRRNS
jgi:hypothetical protein